MAKLNNTQLVLLSTAAQRENGSLYPLPVSMLEGDRAAKAVAQLLKRKLVEERESVDPTSVAHSRDDTRYGLFITAEGLAGIGIGPDNQREGGTGETSAPSPAPTTTARRRTKSADVIALLKREEGATLSELIALTGWLPHTTRAALTGVRKKGHVIDRTKRGNETCYRIVSVA